ncbi:MAG: cbb3-type cytochrome c oxidase N-terminal domain-containing protein [Polyangiaceae bacterium]|nr:cbb3-type cytochrome c oxidase N-terminal domain-containing protein [Polyangiaceae bacterium]
MSAETGKRSGEYVPEDPRTGHEYDGIEEFDNPMPRWWKNIFWATFLFALGYFFHYQLSGQGASVAESYDEDMREFREETAKKLVGSEATEAGLTRLMSNPQMLADAAVIYAARCKACHAEHGEGQIGPNLTDNSWINGKGTLMDIYGVVSTGVLAKGMPAWERQLTPIELQKVVAFVGSLRGKNLPGKAAEGTPLAAP